MIKGREIRKSFEGFDALDGVNFHVPKGSVYGLVGSNGAGKSTLLRHIMGILLQDSGELMVDGEPVFENISMKGRMAFIPDDIFYFKQASILDMKKYYKGIYPSFDENLFEQVAACFSSLKPDMPIRKMSKGMQKQAAFLLAVSIKPELLVLDEPVDGLDPVMRRQIWNILLAEVSKTQMTVIVSSHNLRELEDVCDYVGIMHHGKIILEKSLTDLQGSVTKLQIAFKGEMPAFKKDLYVLHESVMGSLHTLIVKGDPDEVAQMVSAYEPVLMDVLPLTLEEIFIYELGGLDYEIKNILD